MTADPSNSPAIYNDQGVIVRFESAWLKAALHRAARQAGHDSWALLEEFSTAISQFLERQDASDAIVLSDLERVVRATLRDMGYPEIATRFRTVHPFQIISLSAILPPGRPATGRRPTAFFKRLAARIESLHAAKVQLLEFRELQPCALSLAGDDFAGWWDRPLMCARIVGFVRDCIAALQWDGTVRFTIH